MRLYEHHREDARIRECKDVSETITRFYGTEGGNTPLVMEDNMAYGLDRYSWQQGKNAKHGFQIEEELEPSLVARGGSAVAEETMEKMVVRILPFLFVIRCRLYRNSQILMG